jgi:hypothetical protein
MSLLLFLRVLGLTRFSWLRLGRRVLLRGRRLRLAGLVLAGRTMFVLLALLLASFRRFLLLRKNYGTARSRLGQSGVDGQEHS